MYVEDGFTATTWLHSPVSLLVGVTWSAIEGWSAGVTGVVPGAQFQFVRWLPYSKPPLAITSTSAAAWAPPLDRTRALRPRARAPVPASTLWRPRVRLRCRAGGMTPSPVGEAGRPGGGGSYRVSMVRVRERPTNQVTGRSGYLPHKVE